MPLPVPDAAASAPEAPATAGRRAAFVRDPHTQRRFVLLLGEGKQLPSHLCGGGGGSGNCSSSKGVISPGDATSTSAPSTSQPDSSLQPQPQPACVVDKLAAAMQRALRIDAPTAAFYVSSAGCNLRAAMDKVRSVYGSVCLSEWGGACSIVSHVRSTQCGFPAAVPPAV